MAQGDIPGVRGGTRGSREGPGGTRLLSTRKRVIKQSNNDSKPWFKVPKVCGIYPFLRHLGPFGWTRPWPVASLHGYTSHDSLCAFGAQLRGDLIQRQSQKCLETGKRPNPLKIIYFQGILLFLLAARPAQSMLA